MKPLHNDLSCHGAGQSGRLAGAEQGSPEQDAGCGGAEDGRKQAVSLAHVGDDFAVSEEDRGSHDEDGGIDEQRGVEGESGIE